MYDDAKDINEHMRNLTEKLHAELTQEELWARLVGLAEDHKKALMVRKFFHDLKACTAHDEALSRETQKWMDWAEPELQALSPMASDPSEIFNHLNEPVPPPTSLEMLSVLT